MYFMTKALRFNEHNLIKIKTDDSVPPGALLGFVGVQKNRGALEKFPSQSGMRAG